MTIGKNLQIRSYMRQLSFLFLYDCDYINSRNGRTLFFKHFNFASLNINNCFVQFFMLKKMAEFFQN